ncbi:TonB-dependent receptor [Desulfogranum japonicum]|uniref:TonB-dependent receptor n=1 Tax=Desulfogranum japonicum TaxID=231447 RepID=UPI0004214C02|nr:TonB-dependent receptor [Desulfogranum japonicum]
MKLHFLVLSVPITQLVISAPVLPVYAESAPETTGFQLQTITVTATKRETAVEEVPASVTVKDGAFLENHEVRTTEDMTRFVPNLSFKKSISGNAFVARGISTIDTALVSPMGLYINDVAYPLSYMQSQPFFDVERVEVLRGPQSTLYGKNSSSGVINVVLPEPDNEFFARGYIEGGSYETFSGAATARGPLVEDLLFFGITATGMDSQGYMENAVTGKNNVADEQNLSVRGVLRWTPTRDLDVSFSLDGLDRDYGIAYMRYEEGPYATNAYEVSSNEEDRAELDNLGQTLRVKYAFTDMELTSITAHQSTDYGMIFDFDRSQASFGYTEMDLEQDIWSQELRLTGAVSAFEWLGGLYAGIEKLDNDWALNHVNPAITNTRITESDFDNVALFGQISWALTDKLKTTAGLRLDHYDSSGSQDLTRSGQTIIFDQDLSETELLPTAALIYTFHDTVEGYLTYSTGWLSGGYNYYSASSNDTFTYDPEYTQNYEAGVKTRFLDNRLQADLSIFYTDIDDKQVREEVSGGVGAWQFTNAAKAHTTGVEVEFRAMPLKNMEIFGGLGYAYTEVDEWIGTADGKAIDYSGNQLPWAPDLTANIGVSYYWNNGFYGLADVSWNGTQYFDAANALEEDGYALVNLKAGYTMENWDISLWCKNLFDEKYANKKVDDSMGRTMLEDGKPLTVGLTLNWRI